MHSCDSYLLQEQSSHAFFCPAGAKDGSVAAATGAAAKPGRTECEQGRKWVVEHHVNNPEIIISETNPKQAVYIYGCRGCTIQVRQCN